MNNINNNPYADFSKDDLFDTSLIEEIITIDDIRTKEKFKTYLKEKARQYKCLTELNNVIKHVEKKYHNESINQSPTIENISKKILNDYEVRIYQQNIYIYKDNKYTNNEDIIDNLILDCYENASIKFRKEIKEYLKIRGIKVDKNKSDNLIAFKNGIFDLSSQTLLNFSPEYFLTNIINHNYDNGTMAENAIDEFLNDISCNNKARKQTILEIIGYSMTTRTNKQKAFLFLGDGANGKTTLLNLIQEILGTENMSYQSLKELVTNRFSASKLENKLVNSCSEITKEFFQDVSTFKNIVSGDLISVEDKFKSARDIKPYCKLIFSMNELPQVSDKTYGYYRRLFIVPFNANFSEEQKSKFDFNKLITENAIEYLISISIDAYLNIQNAQFTNEEESNRIVENYKTENDNIMAFLEEDYKNIKENPYVHTAKMLYDFYNMFCKDSNYKAYGRNTFIKKLEEGEEYKKYIEVYLDTHEHQKMYRCVK